MIAEEISHQVSICPVGFADILDAPNSIELLQAYAEECLVPGAQPQRLIYEALERAGSLRCFAAFSKIDDLLVGFISVLCTEMPHDGRRLATVESLYVTSDYRDTGAGDLLLLAAEQHAVADGCSNITCVARVGSPFDKVLARRSGYDRTHSQHTRRLT